MIGRRAAIVAVAVGLSVQCLPAMGAAAAREETVLGERLAAATPLKPSTERCRRWRTMARGLGETLAGHAMRLMWQKRACVLAEPNVHDEAVWEWPWRGGEPRADLPPLLRGAMGAWEIRCGRAGMRQRCALVHQAEIGDGSPAAPFVIVTTHFVLDSIGGHESVLWRVYARRIEPGWYGGDGQEPRPAMLAGCHGMQPSDALCAMAAARHPVKPADVREVRVTVGGSDRVLRFARCSALGCMMEAPIKFGAQVASWLWEGRDIAVLLQPQAGQGLRVPLSGLGFRQALAELVRLRREEGRSAAQR